jgi:xanthine/CO dehydrogenase XdhC/CoxF family maturation factor
MSDFYEEILKLRSEGKSGALATIVSTRGSTPREVGLPGHRHKGACL